MFMITDSTKPRIGKLILIIIGLEITVKSSAMDYWLVTFSNLFLKVIVKNFFPGQSLSKPP